MGVMRAFLHRHSFLVLTLGIVPLLSALLIAWGYSRAANQKLSDRAWNSFVVRPELLPPISSMEEFKEWLHSEGQAVDSVFFLFDPDEFSITCSEEKHAQFLAWLDEYFGPANWRPGMITTIQLGGRRGAFGFEVVGDRHWFFDASGAPSSYISSNCYWHFNQNPRPLFGNRAFTLESHRLSYVGPAWPMVVVLLYAFLVPAYFLRRPVMRALRLGKRPREAGQG